MQDEQDRPAVTPLPTTPAVTGRSFEATAQLAIQAARESGGPVIMMFSDIAVQVDPGDAAATIARNYDETAAAVLARLQAMPLVTGRVARVGDVIETLVDDHSTRMMKGSAGVVTDVDIGMGDAVHRIVVRFGRRTVDYLPEDFKDLRYVR